MCAIFLEWGNPAWILNLHSVFYRVSPNAAPWKRPNNLWSTQNFTWYFYSLNRNIHLSDITEVQCTELRGKLTYVNSYFKILDFFFLQILQMYIHWYSVAIQSCCLCTNLLLRILFIKFILLKKMLKISRKFTGHCWVSVFLLFLLMRTLQRDRNLVPVWKEALEPRSFICTLEDIGSLRLVFEMLSWEVRYFFPQGLIQSAVFCRSGALWSKFLGVWPSLSPLVKVRLSEHIPGAPERTLVKPSGQEVTWGFCLVLCAQPIHRSAEWSSRQTSAWDLNLRSQRCLDREG